MGAGHRGQATPGHLRIPPAGPWPSFWQPLVSRLEQGQL